MNEAFGIMDEGYFISRSEILGWVNNLLEVTIYWFGFHNLGECYKNRSPWCRKCLLLNIGLNLPRPGPFTQSQLESETGIRIC